MNEAPAILHLIGGHATNTMLPNAWNSPPTILNIPESVYVFQICLGVGCVALAFIGGFFFGMNREARRRAR